MLPTPGSPRFEFEPLANAPAEPFTAVLYWFHIDVGDCSFYAMAEWPVAEDVAIHSGKRRGQRGAAGSSNPTFC